MEVFMKAIFLIFAVFLFILLVVPQTPCIETAVIKITILYDNYVYKDGLSADWGFSCLIEGMEKTILFDTGTRGDILMHNVKQMNVNLEEVEQVVLSHEHGDHIGGISAVLEENSHVIVYAPVSFSSGFFQMVKDKKAEAVTVKEPVELCQDVWLTGEMGNRIIEQSMILDTSRGLVIITGCAHPGIVNIVKKSKEIMDKDVYLVFGGFHLGGTSERDVRKIIETFKDLGVQKVGATHCTGDRAIEMFKEAYGEDYVQMGVGRVLNLSY
jgi:7,8-dihydropterin-6-yl-methyl-4-(beta-D-ribofuranosyl)aminobenzene 5'-phosphate synthase